MKLISVENITISEFKTLLNPTYNTGTIKINICCLPIYINVFGDKKEMVVELLDFTAKNLKVILPNLNTTDVIIDMGDYKALNENNSIVLISFSIEFIIGDKGFLMLSLPHNLLKYLLV